MVATRAEIDAAMADLGPDPLRPDADPELAWRRIRRASRPIAALLMDQTILSGVGNVYRAEVLFRNRINPHRPGNKLSRRSWTGIWSDLITLMPEGVRDNRIDTVRARAHAGGDGPPAALRQPWRRGLRLPPRGDGVLGLRIEGADRAAGGPQPLLVRSVSTPGLSFPLGRGVVTLAADGQILGVRGADGGSPSYLAGGGDVVVDRSGRAVAWSSPSLSVDVDEAEYSYRAAAGLGLVVRHSFAAGWGIRIALTNQGDDDLELQSCAADLGASPRPSGLGAGRWGHRARAVIQPSGRYGSTARRPTHDGQLRFRRHRRTRVSVRSRWPRVAVTSCSWLWDWYRTPRAFDHGMSLGVPRRFYLPVDQSVAIASDLDEAVVAPGVHLEPVRGQLELSSAVAGRFTVAVSSARGVTRYDIEWVDSREVRLEAAADEAMAAAGVGCRGGPAG